MGTLGQQNRFLAFAFASADLLLEVSHEGTIVFALGAVHPLSVEDVECLNGSRLTDLIASRDKELVRHLLETVDVGQRFGPLNIKASAGDDADQVMISGCRFPGHEDVVCFTFSYDMCSGPAVVKAERDGHTGLVEAEGFDDVALEALQSARKVGKDIKLSLFSFEGQEEFASRVKSDVAEEFLSQTGAVLRAASFADAAGLQGDGKYAILHASDTKIETITDRLHNISKNLDPEKEGIRIESGSIEIEAEMSARDAAGALSFAIKQFACGDDSEIIVDGFSSSLETLMKKTGARMSRFRSALAQKKLSFMQQPIVDLKTKVLHHYEVLVRFEENKSPFEMIRFAEETGLVMELDDMILKQAIRYLSHTDTDEQVSLAVNVSGRSLSSPKFITNLYRAMAEVNFPRSNLMLEITESSIIEDLEQANLVIQKIRKLGHKVCLDDFGAGAASFQYLRSLVVDYIKIDGAYVRTALKRRREAMLLKAIAGLAGDLEIGTIAESIETKDQCEMLLGLGIDQGQGFLFGRPTPLQIPQQDGQAA